MAGTNRILKEQKVSELAKKFAAIEAAVLTENGGVTVAKITSLRANLRKEGIGFEVIKNTLASRAVVGTPLESLKDEFTGPTALAFTAKDPVTLAKLLTEFARTEQKFRIRAGVLSGTLLGKAQVEELAKTPSRDVLLARLVGALQSPYAGYVCVLSGILRKFVYALDAVRRKKEEQGK
ncbi:MAG: 50S ribosomal protein L10 [Pseudomonadota bacterium]